MMYKTTSDSHLWVGLTMLLVPADSSFVIGGNWWQDVQYMGKRVGPVLIPLQSIIAMTTWNLLFK